MKPEEFIRQVINSYHAARQSKYPNKKVHRGRSHTISSEAEDLLAIYLVKNDKTIDAVYIDQTIHIKDVVKAFIPDIVIVRGNTITTFLDLKMDLGYKRDGLIDLCSKDQALLKRVRGKTCSLIDGSTKQKHELTISKKAIYDIVVISGKNISKDNLESQLTESKHFTKNVAVHVLSENIHPNTYNTSIKEIQDKIVINKESFREILSRV